MKTLLTAAIPLLFVCFSSTVAMADQSHIDKN